MAIALAEADKYELLEKIGNIYHFWVVYYDATDCDLQDVVLLG